MKNLVILFLLSTFSANAQIATVVNDTLKNIATKIDIKSKYKFDDKIVFSQSQELQPFIIESRQQRDPFLKPEVNIYNPHDVNSLKDGLLAGSFDFIFSLFAKK